MQHYDIASALMLHFINTLGNEFALTTSGVKQEKQRNVYKLVQPYEVDWLYRSILPLNTANTVIL